MRPLPPQPSPLPPRPPTNGMLVDQDVIDFCNKEMSNVVLSLDGRKEVHDRLRKNLAGLGLKEAKDLVDSAPSTIFPAAKKEDAEKAKAEIEEAGGKVELK